MIVLFPRRVGILGWSLLLDKKVLSTLSNSIEEGLGESELLSKSEV